VSYNIDYGSLQQHIFCDDFETGDTSAWTSTESKALTDLQTEVKQAYTYSGRGGLISAVETELNGHRFTQGMTWNDLGQVATQTYPDLDGYAGEPPRTITNQYSSGTLTGVAPGYATSISYHANGMINQVTHGNGVVDSHDLDPDWMRRHQNIHSTAGSWCETGCYYEYDGAGNIVKIGGGHYLYDKVSRLTESLVRADYTQSYTYDAFGNITSITTNGEKSSINVSWSSNRLSAPVAYDVAGNLVSRGDIAYEWYPTGELSSRTGPGLNRRFLYDANGERLVSENLLNGVQTYTIRGLDGKVLRTYELDNGIWTWTKDYIYRAGQLLASEIPSGANHFTLDHLGSIRVVTDSSGAYLKYHSYYPFGEEAGTDWEDEPMKFTGHERDLEGTTDTDDDLDYMHARYYSPVISRFLSVDPAQLNASGSKVWNRYSYCMNNPLIGVDPDGRIGPIGSNYASMWQRKFNQAWSMPPGQREQALAALKTQTTIMAITGAGSLALNGGALALARVLPSLIAFVSSPQGQKMTHLVGESLAPGPESVGAAPIGSFSRALTQADLGIKGTITELKGTISMSKGRMRVTVNMIDGEISNPMQVMNNLIKKAKQSGASSVEIEGVLANERLLEILKKRYGAVTESGKEVVRIVIE
jgi:RHS repeat-associated protein